MHPLPRFTFSLWISLKHSSVHVGELEHMADKTGYLLALDFSTSYSASGGVAIDSTCMFGAIFVR